ncbi:MAG TPA: molybdopterin-dependent oxidoreductase [Candidatus Binatia bacterium]|nr:molybdopterin-dependent oxidoreductase [Candidatus Binatia bacterium]
MGAPGSASRPSSRAGVLRAGALSGAVALVVLLVGPPLLGGPGFLELVHNGATAFVPLPLFDALLRALGPAAKGLLFVGVAAAVPMAGALLALVVASVGGTGLGAPLRGRPLAALAAWLLGELVVLPLFGQGPLAGGFRGAVVPLQVPFALACLLYGLTLGLLLDAGGREAVGQPSVEGASPPAVDLVRRRFLARAAAVVGWVALAGSGGLVLGRVLGGLRTVAAPRPQAPGGFGPTPRLTPVDDFYVVSKDLLLPRIDPAEWRLRVIGLVERPGAFRLEDLRRLPRVEGEQTLECISNEVVSGGGLIGNQRWAGVRLVDLLAEIGVRPEATHLLWRSADGYTESLPLAEVDEGVWLVDEFGPPGTPLSPEHGFPLRVLIPDRYGMKQPKWLTEIELADHDEPGFWVERGWDRAAFVRIWSRIDEPRAGDAVPVGQPIAVFGVAFAGRRGVGGVEVSADDGQSWVPAELEVAGSGSEANVWRRWRALVRLDRAGPAVLVVRATDGQGRRQDGIVRPPLPAGATGYHRVRVVAVEAG